MKKHCLLAICMVFFATAFTNNLYESLTVNFIHGKADVKSMSVMTFGPEGILFIGDSKAGKIFSIDTEDRKKNESLDRFSLEDLETKVGSLLGVGPKEILIHDFAVNPISQNIYLAASRADAMELGYWRQPNDIAYANVLLKITPDGNITEFSLENVHHSKADVPKVIEEGTESWRKSDFRTDAITDIAYDDGKLYVAGLSNEEFASALRIMDFPFTEKVSHTTLEVYHIAHKESETEAPIRTLLPYTIEGKKYILASYTCTPFVSIPVDDLKPGAHVTVKTLAELGSGNMPIDMIKYTGANGNDLIMMSNSNKTLLRIDPTEIPKIKEGFTTPMPDGQYTIGLPHDVLSGQGISQIDNLNSNTIIALQRQPNGLLNFVSFQIRRT